MHFGDGWQRARAEVRHGVRELIADHVDVAQLQQLSELLRNAAADRVRGEVDLLHPVQAREVLAR